MNVGISWIFCNHWQMLQLFAQMGPGLKVYHGTIYRNHGVPQC